MIQKPNILLQERFNPPKEVLSAAYWCAQRGIAGKTGDKLPMNMSVDACNWINKYPLSFQMHVSLASKRVMMI